MNRYIKGYKVLMLTMTLMGIGGYTGRCINGDRNLINEKNIVRLQVHNVKAQLKEVKGLSNICKIISLINSANIIEKDKNKILGIGYGVIATYQDGHKESLSFLGARMLMKGEWYKVDKDISIELRKIYEEQ